MKTILLTIASLLLAFQVFAANVNVRSFGAIPNDGKDDTKALRKAAEYCRNNPGTILTFQPGIYNLADKDAIQTEQRALAGEFGKNVEEVVFQPDFPYSIGLDFACTSNITLKAEGATLLCEGWMEIISITNAKNFTIEGLTIDYLRKPFSHGKVIATASDHFDVQFSNERIITDKTPMMRLSLWDHNYSHLNPDNFVYYTDFQLLENNVVRFPRQIPDSLLGATANVNHCHHFRPAILIQDSHDTTLKKVTIHAHAGMGIVGFDSHNITMEELSVKPAPGYYHSTNTDATHFASCSGLIRFNACYFQGQGDDATNVHGYYQTIIHTEDNHAELQVKAPTYTHTQALDAPLVGDTLELVEITTLQPVKNLIVLKSSHLPNATSCEVELSEPLPTDYQNYYLMNISKLPRLEFVNNVVNSHLARGVLVKTRGAKIANNIFRHCSGTAIHVGAESWWHEGTHAKNVEITDNMILGCGLGAGTQGGAAGISVIIDAKDTDNTYLHENIIIRNNHINGKQNRCGIYVSNARNVTIENNHVTNCQTDIITNSTTNLTITH